MKFKRVGLIASLALPTVIRSLEMLEQFLTARGVEVLFEEHTADIAGTEQAGLPVEDLGPQIDLAIVVGGDGSLLSAARALVNFDVPLLGVNRGRLGFLTDILPNEIEQRVGQVLNGHYHTSARTLLEVSVHRGDREISRGSALNDVVLHPGESVRMMEFELYINDRLVYTQNSDGLIIATPTGSTAYALSAGGPIVHPEMDAIVVVPLNPHTLSNRPIVVSGSSRIEIVVGSRNMLHPLVTCDGQDDILSVPGDRIRITQLEKFLSIIHPEEHNFYEVCRSKLGWASRLDSDFNQTGE